MEALCFYLSWYPICLRLDLGASPEFAAALAELPSYDTTNLNKNETYALWINVYNMLAVNTVATHQCESDLFGECAVSSFSCVWCGVVCVPPPPSSVYARVLS